MRHDPDDATIGAYLTGDLTAGQWEAFEAHLLNCERCWAEVAHEPAPEPLRERVYRAVAAEPPARRGHRTRYAVAAALVLIAAITTVVIIDRLRPNDQPPAIVYAIAAYQDDRLPGSDIPQRRGPDLSALRLAETGGGAGNLAGQPVTAYAYRDDTGRRLLIYLSDRPFPMPAQADHPYGPTGAGLTRHRGVAVLCSRSPHTVLILGEDEHLVWQAANTLDLA